jgi:hypothetical protein
MEKMKCLINAVTINGNTGYNPKRNSQKKNDIDTKIRHVVVKQL